MSKPINAAECADVATLRAQLQEANAQIRSLQDTVTLLEASLQFRTATAAAPPVTASHANTPRRGVYVSGGSPDAASMRLHAQRAAPFLWPFTVPFGQQLMNPLLAHTLSSQGVAGPRACVSIVNSMPGVAGACPVDKARVNTPAAEAVASANPPKGGGKKGKLEPWERKLTDDFVAAVKARRVTVARGDLARHLRAFVNTARHQEFYEKLVSRRKLNVVLAEYLTPRRGKRSRSRSRSPERASPRGFKIARPAYKIGGELADASHAMTARVC